jgi:YfiH family protein
VSVALDREVPGRHHAAVPCAELESWRTVHGLVAGITTRGAGSPEFNLGLMTGEPARDITGRWQELLAAFSPGFESVAVGLQQHGAEIRLHEGLGGGWLVLNGYDGHLTCRPGILLAVSVADCVPVYLAHPASGSVALLHAGWRGIAAGILERGVRRLSEVSGAAPGEFLVHLGAAIGEAHYEVGPEVLGALGVGPADGPHTVDLRGVLARRARQAGLGQITTSPWCTYADDGLFWSHRRDGDRAGRMVAYLGRPLT